jgi:hypothetical protein
MKKCISSGSDELNEVLRPGQDKRSRFWSLEARRNASGNDELPAEFPSGAVGGPAAAALGWAVRGFRPPGPPPIILNP